MQLFQKTILSDKDLEGKQNKEKKKTNIPNLKSHYKKWLIFFSLGFAIFIFSPLVTGENYSFEASPIGTTQTLAPETSIQLINKEWNPDNGLLKVDLEVLAPSGSSRLANIEIEEAFVAYVNDPEDEIVTELIEVSPNYYVLLAQFLPEKFGVVGVGLSPAYIEPEIEDDAEVMENRVVQYYFYEEDMEINPDLQPEELETYQVDLIKYRQEELQESIEEKNNDIRLSRIRIENYRSAMEEVQQNDNDYLTEEESKELNDELVSIEQDIRSEEITIKNIEEEIESLEDRIALYESQKESILNKK